LKRFVQVISISFLYMLRGQPALAEWSAKNASFREHSRVGHQGFIGPFRFPVSLIDRFKARQSCQGLVSVP